MIILSFCITECDDQWRSLTPNSWEKEGQIIKYENSDDKVDTVSIYRLQNLGMWQGVTLQFKIKQAKWLNDAITY